MFDIQNLLGPSTLMKKDGKPDGIGMITPKNVVKDMVDLLPDDVWNKDTKFLDIACKSGNFLIEIYNRLINHPKLIEQLGDNIEYRREWILNNQLYGISMSEFDRVIATRNLYGYNTENSNIVYINNYIDNYIKSETGFKFFTDKLKETFGIMKFDVVIGNPPYNKGMDLDFIDVAYKISEQYVSMIVPAKWQTAAPDQSVSSKRINYGEFRKMYTSYIKRVCFYPDCRDIFSIEIPEGITYFLMSKEISNETIVENRSKYIKNFNSTITRDISNGITLNNIGNDIIRKLGPYEQFRFNIKTDASSRYKVMANNQVSFGKTERSYLLSNDNNVLVTGLVSLIDNKKGERHSSNSAITIFCSDSEDECKSFISWINSKFVRFLVLMNIGGRPVLNNHTFRFVPNPGKFDHIFTDAELYKKYNLTDKEINIIESVIKERK